ncbi:MAG TPA: WD40 repeat domain-containing protein [Actinophytocola sp.]|uniref:WD40 repeat domain-containing protein n=1 Tax=Actinophytocola sp. TaxID=1872138 RepID=UPI002DB870F5|nr:WD40 repeat domain-containing protein [Actinophytocola sp.]HEU5475284.1 WD40 repeat domain-containing protein [Actinophytocola sp.]
MRIGPEPDPRTASDQAEFRALLRELMVWAGCGSLHRLEAVARRQNVSMPVSTADRALSTDRLPTADFVRRFVVACRGDVGQWVEARERLADRKYARNQPPVALPTVTEMAEFCPYPGLAAFTSEQSQWFFGRERATAEVIRHLTERLDGTGPLMVVAPSGAGKSSLLRAGVVPALRRAVLPGSNRWPCAVFTPTTDPVGELTTQLGALPPADRVVLVVDQFEETFTLCAQEQPRQEFIRELCALAASRALVLIGLRADFYGRCAAYPELVESSRHGQVLLGAMRAAELRDAIIKPAAAVGLEILPGLVEIMLADLGASEDPTGSGYEPGALPLLSHTLFVTWQHRERHTLTPDGYRLAGGVHGAIAATAERAYRQLDPNGQRIARRHLLRLIQVGERTDDTRRRLDRNRLINESPDPALAEVVMETLSRARLVTLDADSAEITHEALLHAWPRLREWLTNDRAGLLVHQRLSEAAEAWEREGQHSSALYQGPRLAAAREWAETTDRDLSPLERDFLDAAIGREQAEQLAARRRTGQLRQLVAGLTVLFLLAAAATVVAVRAQDTANRQRDEAISRKVAGEIAALRVADPALANQLSLAAYRLAPTAEARGALLSSFAMPYSIRLTGHTHYLHSVVFSPDGHTMASASADHTARLWDTTNPHRPAELAVLTGHADYLTSTAFSPDGRKLATASGDHTIRLWNITNPRDPSEIVVITGTDVLHDVAFSPDGQTLAIASGDDTLRLLDITDPHTPVALATLPGHRNGVASVTFSPDGHTLATGGGDHAVRLWNVTNRRNPSESAVLVGHADLVNAVTFSPDGRLLASASYDHTARLWDPARATPLSVLGEHTDLVYSAAFSLDGRTLATASADNTARLWDLTDPGKPTTVSILVSHAGGSLDTNAIATVAYSPDGRTLATGSYDHTVRLWDLPESASTGRVGSIRPLLPSPDGRGLHAVTAGASVHFWNITDRSRLTDRVTTAPIGNIPDATAAFSADARLLATTTDNSIRLWEFADPRHLIPVATLTPAQTADDVNVPAFSPDGHLLIVVGVRKRLARLWDITDPGKPVLLADFPLTSHTNSLNSVRFSPDSRYLVTAGFDHSVRFWKLDDPRHPTEFAAVGGHTNAVTMVAFSPDQHTMATASFDNTVRLWDVTDPLRPTEIATLTGHTGFVEAVEFSPDGHLLATGSDDRTARLWDITDPRHPTEWATLTGQNDMVSSVAFGPGGGLITASADGTVRFSDLDTVRVGARVCALAHPSLSRSDWDKYFLGLEYQPPCA